MHTLLVPLKLCKYALVANIFFIPAGGQAINSRMERILTVVPEGIHDRSGIFMGSYDEVQKVIDVHKRYAE